MENFVNEKIRALLAALPKTPEFQVIADTIIEIFLHQAKELTQLKTENVRLKADNQLLRDDINRLKKQPPRPKIEPSKLESSGPVSVEAKKKNWRKTSKNGRLVIDEEIKVHLLPKDVPPGAIFKGYEKFVVQELVIKKHVVCYLRATYQLADGKYLTAPLPQEIDGYHFGPGLRQFIVNQSCANRVPNNRIAADLEAQGFIISDGALNNILLDTAELLRAEKDDLLDVALESGYIQTDDTGGRHKSKNCFMTVICNNEIAYFKSSYSKSRINFLEILCGSKIEYTVTEESIAYAVSFKIKPTVMLKMQTLLLEHSSKSLSVEEWTTFVKPQMLGKGTCRILTEAALIGTLMSRGSVNLETILMSDGAPQFNLFVHALCWIHIERSIKRLIPESEPGKQEQMMILDDFWQFYRALKSYKEAPTEALKNELEKRFDEIFSIKATDPALAQVLKKIRDNKDQLLLVLDHPEIPLHNNASESNIREPVIKRKISGGTRSDKGRDARDIFTSLLKTCKKQALSFWVFLRDRLRHEGKIDYLADTIRRKRQAALAGP